MATQLGQTRTSTLASRGNWRTGKHMEEVAIRSRLRLFIGFGDPLLAQSVASLAQRDPRFEPATSWACVSDLNQRLPAGLLAGAKDHIKSLLQECRGRLACCVLLTDDHAESDKSVLDGLDCPTGLVQRGTPWSGIAAKLLDTAGRDFEVSAGSVSASERDQLCLESLSRREREVLVLFASGCSVTRVASILSIAPSTVENHKSRLMKKLDISRSVELVRYAIRVGVAIP